jgi:tetratricopeptide (TPR) repeat protein
MTRNGLRFVALITALTLIVFAVQADDGSKHRNPRSNSDKADPVKRQFPAFCRAIVHTAMGFYDQATIDCDEALKNDPKDLRIHQLRGWLLVQRQEYEKAVADLNAVLRGQPKNLAAYLLRATAFCELKDYDRAIADCTEVIRLDPKNYKALAQRGKCYLDIDVPGKAIADCTRSVELNSSCPQVFITRSSAHWNRGQCGKALDDMDAAIVLDPNEGLNYSWRALIHLASENYDIALADAEKGIALSPDEALCHAYHGYIHAMRKEYASALLDFANAIILDPRGVRFKISLSRREIGLGFGGYDPGKMRPDWNAIIAAAGARIEKQRDNMPAHFQRAYAEWCNYEYDRAIADYTEVLRLDPEDGQAYSGRGETYLSSHKYDLALNDFDAALRLNPNDAQAHTGRAWALWGTLDLSAAVDELKVALRTDSKALHAHFLLGSFLSHQKQIPEALAAYTEAIRLEPDYEGPYLDRGLILLEQREFQPALNDFGKAIKLNPKAPRAYEGRAWLYHELGQWKNALADLSQLIGLEPKKAEWYARRCDLHLKLDQYEKALADCNEAIRLKPEMKEYGTLRDWLSDQIKLKKDEAAKRAQLIASVPDDIPPPPIQSTTSGLKSADSRSSPVAGGVQSLQAEDRDDSLVEINSPEFCIPFTLKTSDATAIRLHVSRDKGKTWHEEQTIKLEASKAGDFTFHASADGIYWFAVQLVKKDGSLDPEKIESGRLGMQVMKVKVQTDFNPTVLRKLKDKLQEISTRISEVDLLVSLLAHESEKNRNDCSTEITSLHSQIAELERRLADLENAAKKKQ